MTLSKIIIDMAKYLDAQVEKNKKTNASVLSDSNDKQQAIKFILSLLKSAPKEAIYHFVETTQETAFGHLLYLCCRLLAEDRDKKVRHDAIRLIKQLLNILEDCHNVCNVCSSALASAFLPGVSSALIKFVISDDKLPRAVIVDAIDALALIIALSFGSCSHTVNDVKRDPALPPIQKLTGNNLSNASENLSSRLAVLINFILQHRSDTETLISLINLCDKLISKCCEELVSRSLRPILRFLITNHSETQSIDHQESKFVKTFTEQVLNKIRTMVGSSKLSGYSNLNHIVIDELLDAFKHMHMLVKSSLFNELSSQMALIAGQLLILDHKSLQNLLESTEQRPQMIDILVELAELEPKQSFILMTSTALEQSSQPTNIISKQSPSSGLESQLIRKRFKYINNLIDRKRHAQMCSNLVSRCDPYLVFDIIKTDLLLNYNHYPAATIVVNEMLKAIHQAPVDLISELTEILVDFLESNYLKETIEPIDVSRQVMQIVLTLELFDCLAALVQRSKASNDNLSRFLMTSLCPLLNKAASPNLAISHTARATLEAIATYWSTTLRDLIHSNVDYIIDGVSYRLHNFSDNHLVPNVIAVAFSLSDPNMLCLYDDIFVSSFKLLDTHYHQPYSYPLVLMLSRVIDIIASHNTPKKLAIELSPSDDPFQDEHIMKKLLHEINIDRRIASLKNKLIELAQREQEMEIAENPNVTETIEEMENSDTNDNNEMANVADANDPPKLPYHVELVSRILAKCVHLISSRYVETRILALHMASRGFEILRDYEDTLLPLAHQLWAPLLTRLNTSNLSEDLATIRAGFHFLICLASCAKDFIRARTLSSVMPRLCRVLRSQASVSQEYCNSSNTQKREHYYHTIAYKCQLEILQNIGSLVYSIQVGYTQLWPIIETLISCIKQPQPEALVKAAKRSLAFVTLCDAYSVWYFARQANCVSELNLHQVFQLSEGQDSVRTNNKQVKCRK